MIIERDLNENEWGSGMYYLMLRDVPGLLLLLYGCLGLVVRGSKFEVRGSRKGSTGITGWLANADERDPIDNILYIQSISIILRSVSFWSFRNACADLVDPRNLRIVSP